MKYFYPAKFIREGNKFNVEFLDFDNLFTFGDDFYDAYFMAQDVLFNMLPYLDKLPEPSFDYMNIETKDNEFITLVDLDPKEHEKRISEKTVNTLVTMPEWLKNAAIEKGLNFSKILQESLKKELNIL